MKPKGNLYNAGRNYDYDYGTGLNDDSDDMDHSSSNDYYDQIPKSKGINIGGSNYGYKQNQPMKHSVPLASKYDVNNPTYGLGGSMGFNVPSKGASSLISGSLGLGLSMINKKTDAYNIDLNTNKFDFNTKIDKKEPAKQDKDKDKNKSKEKDNIKDKDKDKDKERKKETKQNVDFFDQLDDELEQKKDEEEEEYYEDNYKMPIKEVKDNENKIEKEPQYVIKKSDSIKEDINESIQPEDNIIKKSSITSQDNHDVSHASKKDDYDLLEDSYNKYVPNQPHSAEAMEEYMKKHTIFPMQKDTDNDKDKEEKKPEVKEDNEDEEDEEEYKEDFDVNVDTLQNQSNDLNHLHKLSDTSIKNMIQKKDSNLEESDKKLVSDDSIKEKLKSDVNHLPTESLDIDLSERMKILSDSKKPTIPPKKVSSITSEPKKTESNEIDYSNRLKLLSEEKEESQSKEETSPFKMPIPIQSNKDKVSEKYINQPQIQSQSQQQQQPQPQLKTSNNIVSSDDVESLIRKEIGNYIKSGNLNTLLSLNSNNNQQQLQSSSLINNSTGINEIKNEFNQLSISKNQLFSEGLRFKKFDNQKLYRSVNISAYFEGYSGVKPKINISQLKLESSLNEERKRKELIAYELNQVKELNKKLEEELSKMQYIKIDNLNLSKKIENSDSQISKMTNDFDELKNLYDHQIKLIEERIQSNAETSTNHKANEIEKKFQMELIVLQSALDESKLEVSYFKSKNEALDAENTKLRLNIEQNDTIAKLKNENYLLHEKNNELMKIKEAFELEVKRLKETNNMNKGNGISISNANVKIQESNVNIGQSLINKSDPVFVNQIQMIKEGPVQTAFEQILNERESNAQENLIKSYVKEIERLNEEIVFLKSMPNGDNTVIKNNYIATNKKKVINPALKESIEEQMKKLQAFLFKEESKYLIAFIEKEFNRLQDKEHEGEISFNNFISTLQNINVPLMPNELIEIFNNFPRSHGNMIRYSTFLTALLSNSPSSFYMQSDPSYLNTLESKLLIATNRVKELEKFILVSSSEKDEQKATIEELSKVKAQLEDKVNQLNSQILNYFLYREEKHIANPEIIQIKEKFKSLETTNMHSNNELCQRLANYEKKIEEMNKADLEKEIKVKEINALKESIIRLKTETSNKETALNNEINSLKQKLAKYKKNYCMLNSKSESLTKEKERILSCLKEKGITADKVLTFVNSYEEVKVLNCKLSELEKKNEDREERYNKICINANAIQMQKEIETVTKHYEKEKTEMMRIILQKNNEVEIIKKVFAEILIELEKMKASKYR